MAELIELIPIEDEAVDRRILDARVSGKSVDQIAEDLMLPRH